MAQFQGRELSSRYLCAASPGSCHQVDGIFGFGVPNQKKVVAIKLRHVTVSCHTFCIQETYAIFQLAHCLVHSHIYKLFIYKNDQENGYIWVILLVFAWFVEVAIFD